MSKVLEHNVATGEVIERDMTADELAIAKKDAEDFKAKAEALAEAEAKKASALAKLEALGLDADDLKALGL